MTARRTARRLASTAVALTLGAPVVALGQEVGPYDPLGIRAGSFLVFPQLTVSEAYDTNVTAVKNNEKDDFITLLQPLVKVQSNFSRHSLNLTAGGNIAFHANETDENYQDAFLQSNGRLDITRQNYLDAAVNVARAHQGRDDVENNPNQSLKELYQYGGSLSFTQLFNRLNFTLTGDVARDNYQSNIDSDRDQNSYTGELRTGFFISPRINTFVYGTYNVTNRDQKVDSSGVERDTKSWGTGVGTTVDLTDLLTTTFQVGYTRQSYAEADFSDKDGVGYNLSLTWTPTRLTTVRATGGGDFRPTSSQGSDAQTNFQSTVGASIDHELLRNVHIGAHVNYIQDAFSGPSRTDNTVAFGGGVTYLLNRNFSVDAGYTYQQRFSDESTDEFTRNLFLVGLTARL